MPDDTFPGVYVEESDPGPHPIAGVSTSTAGFIGLATSGPFTPTLITGFTECVSAFGNPGCGGFLGYTVRGFFDNGGAQCYVLRIEATADPFESVQALESLDVSIVCSPDADSISGMAGALIAHCEKMRYRFAVLDGPQTPAPTGPPDALRSSFAAYYYPWLLVAGASGGVEIAVPPGAFVAGIYARTDHEQGVWHAPANKALLGVTGLNQVLTQQQSEVLNAAGVNVIRVFPGRGNRVWGAHTTSPDLQWKYVSIRRYLSYLEHSIEKGTQWVVFEPNGEDLWGAVRRSVSDFLLNEWKSGGLQGSRAEDAFLVRCDRTTMTQNDLDNGRLIVEIGVAPLRPAEFVIFRIGQWTADAKDCGA